MKFRELSLACLRRLTTRNWYSKTIQPSPFLVLPATIAASNLLLAGLVGPLMWMCPCQAGKWRHFQETGESVNPPFGCRSPSEPCTKSDQRLAI
ncbi:unnamed protein product [Protopolystoma xenopodis]|uniref:Uncharacterized protein n=1 Tax=Protopolystoma xenopodis TaxID=117903 RepID=A0A3S5B4B3_9PLAT|nr:unnamed protein product [Protopolystoma xenopodis]